MRTTLTIDDDLAGMLKKRAQEMEKPFKAVVNMALRKGLILSADEKDSPITIKPHRFGALNPAVDWNRLNQLSDTLETGDFLAKDS